MIDHYERKDILITWIEWNEKIDKNVVNIEINKSLLCIHKQRGYIDVIFTKAKQTTII